MGNSNLPIYNSHDKTTEYQDTLIFSWHPTRVSQSSIKLPDGMQTHNLNLKWNNCP